MPICSTAILDDLDGSIMAKDKLYVSIHKGVCINNKIFTGIVSEDDGLTEKQLKEIVERKAGKIEEPLLQDDENANSKAK